jgi:hypothetical protein
MENIKPLNGQDNLKLSFSKSDNMIKTGPSRNSEKKKSWRKENLFLNLENCKSCDNSENEVYSYFKNMNVLQELLGKNI